MAKSGALTARPMMVNGWHAKRLSIKRAELLLSSKAKRNESISSGGWKRNQHWEGDRKTDRQQTPPPPLLQERLPKWQQSSRGPQAGSPQGPHRVHTIIVIASSGSPPSEAAKSYSRSACMPLSSSLPSLSCSPVQFKSPLAFQSAPLSKSEISILTLLLLHPSQSSQPCVCPCSYNEALGRRGGPRVPGPWSPYV